MNKKTAHTYDDDDDDDELGAFIYSTSRAATTETKDAAEETLSAVSGRKERPKNGIVAIAAKERTRPVRTAAAIAAIRTKDVFAAGEEYYEPAKKKAKKNNNYEMCNHNRSQHNKGGHKRNVEGTKRDHGMKVESQHKGAHKAKSEENTIDYGMKIDASTSAFDERWIMNFEGENRIYLLVK